MKIICDANVGSTVARALSEAGHDVVRVATVVPRLLPLLDFDRLNGHMTVVGAERDRRTPFPKKS